MITRHLDQEDGIILVHGSGHWSVAMVAEHYAALRRMIEVQRALGRPIRILSDITDAQRQNAEVEAHILNEMASTYRPGDRVALLARDGGDQNYVREILGGALAVAFQSRIAAEMWLVSDAVRPGWLARTDHANEGDMSSSTSISPT